MLFFASETLEGKSAQKSLLLEFLSQRGDIVIVSVPSSSMGCRGGSNTPVRRTVGGDV
jgi:hypothetical protein